MKENRAARFCLSCPFFKGYYLIAKVSVCGPMIKGQFMKQDNQQMGLKNSKTMLSFTCKQFKQEGYTVKIKYRGAVNRQSRKTNAYAAIDSGTAAFGGMIP